MNSEEEYLAVYNLDTADFTDCELIAEIVRTARIVARDPRQIVWRGTDAIPVQVWGSERIRVCRALLRGQDDGERPARRGKDAPKRPTAWTR